MNRTCIITAAGLPLAALVVVVSPDVARAAPAADLTPTPVATASAIQQQAITVTAQNPAGAHAPVYVTVTGLEPGQWIDVDGAPAGWTMESPYHREVQQQGTSPVQVTLDAPVAGWPEGTYEWSITLPGGVFVYRNTTFTASAPTPMPSQPTPSEAGTSPAPNPPREKARSGGLAKTGV